MKKYITTDKHPELKEGVIIFKGLYSYRTNFFLELRNEFDVDTWLEKGYIKELQEKEFTKDDMIEFAKFAKVRKEMSQLHLTWDSEFNEWLKQRNEQI